MQEEIKKSVQTEETHSSEKKLEEVEEIVITTKENENNQTKMKPRSIDRSKFTELSNNMHQYLSAFYTIRDMAKFVNINKKIRKSILNEPIFQYFKMMREILKKEYKKQYIYLINLKNPIEFLKEFEISKKFSQLEQRQILQVLFGSLYKNDGFIYAFFPFDFLDLILSAENCPIDLVVYDFSYALNFSLELYSYQNPKKFDKIQKEIISNMIKFSGILKKNYSFRKLNIHPKEYILNALDWLQIFEGIAKNSRITDLDCELNFYKDQDLEIYMPKFIECLNENKSITKLNLQIINIKKKKKHQSKESAISSLRNLIANNKTIEQLDFKSRFDFLGKDYYFHYQRDNINNTIIINIYCSKIRNDSPLISLLSLDFSQLENCGGNNKRNNFIYTVYLYCHQYEDSQMKCLCDIIDNNPNIKTLVIKFYKSNNVFESCKTFYNFLEKNSTLETLKLKGLPNMEEKRIQSFISLLKNNNNLINIDVSDNYFYFYKESKLIPIIEVLKENKQLKTLKLPDEFNEMQKTINEILAQRQSN